MSIHHIIFIISMVIWLLPSIRQKSNEYFYFFMTMTLGGPTGFLLAHYFDIYQMTVASFFILLQFFALQIPKDKRNSKFVNIAVIFIYLSLLFSFDWPNYCVIAMYIVVLIKLLQDLTIQFFHNGILSIFIVVLVFFLISEVVNNILVLSATAEVMILFYITLVFQFLVAIFFSFFTPNNPRLLLKLKNIGTEIETNLKTPNN